MTEKEARKFELRDLYQSGVAEIVKAGGRTSLAPPLDIPVTPDIRTQYREVLERERVQPRMIWRPLPWYRRYNRWDWGFLAVCLAGAAACVWVITR